MAFSLSFLALRRGSRERGFRKALVSMAAKYWSWKVW